MKKIVLFAIVFLFAMQLKAEVQDTLKIATTAQCEMCKDRIEEAVNKLDGINYVNLDVASAVVSVLFDDEKTSPKEIRKKIASVGYDADDEKKDKRAYKRLPKCCQLGGHK